MLLHQDGLWRGAGPWLSGLDPETFTAMLPLVRRAFSGFQPPERRAMGEKVKKLKDGQEACPVQPESNGRGPPPGRPGAARSRADTGG